MPQVDCNFVFVAPNGARALIGPNTSDPDWVGFLGTPTMSSQGTTDPTQNQIIVGLDDAEIRDNHELKSQGDGAVQGNNWMGGRAVTFVGIIPPLTDSVADITFRENKLKAALNALRADGTLTWTETGSVEKQLKYRKNAPVRLVGQRGRQFFISIYSEQPEILASHENSAAIYTPGPADYVDNFTTDSRSLYTYYSGNATQPTVTGGQLSFPNSQQIYMARPDVGLYGDVENTVKFTTGTTVAGQSILLAAHFLNNTNGLAAEINTVTNVLAFWKLDNNVWTSLSSTALSPVLTASTTYWARFRIQANTLTLEIWKLNPPPSGVMQQSTTFTLTTNAVKFGAAVQGACGLFVNSSTAISGWTFDDLTFHSLGIGNLQGVTFPLKFPVQFSQIGAMAAGVVSNNGTVDTWPRFQIKGPVQNPVLTNNLTGAYLAFTWTLGASDVMIVDTYAHTVTVNGVQQYSALTGGYWWPLVPGSNPIILSATTFTAPAGATIFWHDAFL